MYQLSTSVLFCSFLLTLGLPDISDNNTQRSDDEDMANSVHIRPPDIVQGAQGKRSSHVSSLQDEEPPKSPKTSSTPKRRQPATGSGASGQASTVDHEPTTKTVITVEDSEKKPAQDHTDHLQVAFIHSEMLCVRENLQKMDKLPEEVKLMRNSIDSAHGDITSVGANRVRVKTDVMLFWKN